LEDLIPHAITESENTLLSAIPTPEQIKDTLFNMEDQKAPDPDGFPA